MTTGADAPSRPRPHGNDRPPRGVGIGLLAVAAAAALWALGATVASHLFSVGVDSLDLIQVRTWITGLGLGILALRLHGRRPPRPPPRTHTILFGLAVGAANATFFLAIEHLPVAVAIVLQNLAPALVAAWVLLATRRAPNPRTAAALLGALLGVALVAGLPGTSVDDMALLGVGFGLLTAAGVAAFSILGERSSQAYGAIGSMARAFAVASLAWMAFQAPQGAPELLDETSHLPGVLVVGLLGTMLPFVLFSWGVARAGAQAAAVGVSLEPVFGAVMAWTWLGQPLSPLQLAGGGIVLMAVVYLQRRPAHQTTDPARRWPHGRKKRLPQVSTGCAQSSTQSAQGRG